MLADFVALAQSADPDFTRPRKRTIEHRQPVLVRIEDCFVPFDAAREARCVVRVLELPNLAALDAIDAHAEPAQGHQRGVRGVIGNLQADRDRTFLHALTASTKLLNNAAPPDGASTSPPLARSRWLKFHASRSGCGMIASTFPSRFTSPAQPSAEPFGIAAASTTPLWCA